MVLDDNNDSRTILFYEKQGFLIALQQKSFSRGLRLTKRNCQTGIESKILTS